MGIKSSAALSAVPAVWEVFSRLRAWTYRSGLRRAQRLRAPVVSIGNLTFGGTGKTPFTIWLADELARRGYRAAILTRGYRRSSKGLRSYAPGSDWRQPANVHDGDEVQLYLRHLPSAAVGVAARRYEAGAALEREHPIDVHLLDDGFQHLRLARHCDIVLLDSSSPWGIHALGGSLPRALREPVEALRRADALVLTRCEKTSPSALQELEDFLRRLHPGAPVFRSSTRLNGFRESLDSPAIPVDRLSGRPVVAFCGVGNPDSFFNLLSSAGLTITATRIFPDHHHYNDQDLDQLNDLARTHSADRLITTEKDVVNLPHPARFADNFIVPACWADIALEIGNQQALLDLIAKKIGPPPVGSGRH